MHIGTNIFLSQAHAVRYYAVYGDDAQEVARKMRDGEIAISSASPASKAVPTYNGKRILSARLVDDGCRWQVEG